MALGQLFLLLGAERPARFLGRDVPLRQSGAPVRERERLVAQPDGLGRLGLGQGGRRGERRGARNGRGGGAGGGRGRSACPQVLTPRHA
ncbi:hypothetical protein F3L20_33750 (plasmid) [Streptomyces tendae]|uniref:Uncharacterized protein n=1 Tax=Streptomyces tendae TaxID=1932 RepID=A0ABX6A0X9_STRTE|nr:hypothetical protein F3L20_33750 [Streptomyces tendae]